MTHIFRRPRKTAGSQIQKILASPPLLGLAVGGGLAAVAIVLFVWRSGDRTEPAGDLRRGPVKEKIAEVATPVNPQDVPLPERATGVCRIYTPEEGFFVLIDGEPARDAEGNRLQTPCAVTLIRGDHAVTVAKPGFRDASQTVHVRDEAEIVFDPQPDSSGDSGSVLLSAYFDAPLAEPIPLSTINSAGTERDPFLSPDGLTLWFAADRPEGRGIYEATRPGPFHSFGPPKLVAHSPDWPASPSATADGLMLAYVVPQKQRIWGLVRPSRLEAFGEKEPLRYSHRSPGVWPSAQLLGDGLSLYWTEIENGKSRTFLSTRTARDREFQKTTQDAFPGLVPCLSHDGLRQFSFDGRVLRRARRVDLGAKFSAWEVVANLQLPNYAAANDRRQYCLSDDEQWLFYCDDPQEGGDLYLARIFNGRGWGFVPRGRKIPPRAPAIAAVTNDGDDHPLAATRPEPAAEPVDPRSLPLPYAAFRKQFLALVEGRRYDEAAAECRRALADPAHAADVEILQWDLEELEHIVRFWSDVREACAALKPGTPVSIRNAKLQFTRLAGDVLHGTVSGKESQKNITEMTPADLISLVENTVERNDAASQLRMAIFLHYDPAGNERSANARLERADTEGEEFRERLAARQLHLARKEFERENVAACLQRIQELLTAAPGSAAAKEAAQLEENLYERTKWNPVGRRRWETPNAGEYAANSTRAADSYLLSPRQYENFELRLEWKTTGVTGQGGVFFRYPGRGNPYQNAFKIQLSNDFGIAADMHSTGSLFTRQGPKVNAVLEEGKWNTLLMRVVGEQVEVVINDKPVLTARAAEPEIPLKGHVALDGVAGGISYRRILLVDLPAAREEK